MEVFQQYLSGEEDFNDPFRIEVLEAEFSCEDIEMSGTSLVDGYSSLAGEYGSGNSRLAGGIRANGNIKLSGSAEVIGDAVYGGNIRISGNARISGTARQEQEARDCRKAETSAAIKKARFNNNNEDIPNTRKGKSPFKPANSLRLKLERGDELLLPEGVYYFESVKLSGRSVMRTAGLTYIFVSGDVELTGGAEVGPEGLPPDLRLITSGKVKIEGGSSFYGILFAPQGEVKIGGGGKVFGSIQAGSFKAGGSSQIHLDRTLLDHEGPSVQVFPEHGAYIGQAPRIEIRWRDMESGADKDSLRVFFNAVEVTDRLSMIGDKAL
ncbi:MAG: hypothetical protein AB1715_14640, partial [Acidobacteriota bacterium]